MFQTTNEEGKQHLAAGADVNAKNDEGGTLLDWAIDWERTETVDLLRKHAGKIFGGVFTKD